jgi:hypothetical protein
VNTLLAATSGDVTKAGKAIEDGWLVYPEARSVVIVVGIQAFIFAALSAIYIGSAIEPQH